MKSLKPSAKENRRYILIKGENNYKKVESSVLEFSGVLGLAESGLKFIKKENGNLIVSITRESVNKVRAGFAVFKDKIEVLRVSGTLKGLRK